MKIFEQLKHRRLWGAIIFVITFISLKLDLGLDLSNTDAITNILISIVESIEKMFELGGVVVAAGLNLWSLIKPKQQVEKI